MENGKQKAHPFINKNGDATQGLTKREYFAGLAMQGMLANIDQSYGEPNVNAASMEFALKRQQQLINDVAIKAVEYSDALLAELDKSKSEKDGEEGSSCWCDNGIITCPGCNGEQSKGGVCAGCHGKGKVTCGKCGGNH